MSNLKIEISLNGVEEYLETLANIGADVEKIAAEAVYESAKPVYKDIRKWLIKHKYTGASLEGLTLSKPESYHGIISVDLSISSDKNKNAWHIAFVEYGTPTVEADPGIERAFKKNKRKVKQIQKDILSGGGII